MDGRFPERIVEKAIERMLPRGPLGRVQLGNLRVYPGPEHPHEAQQPQTLDVGAMNRKNVRSA
jgi:large subunit ribosomal protein L13